MQISEYTYKDLESGKTESFEVEITEQMVHSFAELSGDVNPLHTDAAYAATTEFKQPIAHGLIVGALFSRLVGMYLPGKYALYLAQILEFKKPILPPSRVRIEGIIEQKVDALNIIRIKTSAYILPSQELAVSGVATVKLLQ